MGGTRGLGCVVTGAKGVITLDMEDEEEEDDDDDGEGDGGDGGGRGGGRVRAMAVDDDDDEGDEMRNAAQVSWLYASAASLTTCASCFLVLATGFLLLAALQWSTWPQLADIRNNFRRQ